MSKKMIASLILLFAAPLIIYLIWPTEESRIRKLFREGAAAFEARKMEDVMAKVSFNYTDEHGLSYLYLKDGGARLLKQMDEIKIEYEIKEIGVKEDKAVVAVDVRVIAGRGKDAGYVAGDAAKPLSMKFHLEKERTKWLVVKTEGLPVWY
jgi:hypothetical protein